MDGKYLDTTNMDGDYGQPESPASKPRSGEPSQHTPEQTLAWLQSLTRPVAEIEPRAVKLGICQLSADALQLTIPEQDISLAVPLEQKEYEWLLDLPQTTGFRGLNRLLIKIDYYGLAGLIFKPELGAAWQVCTSIAQLKKNRRGTRETQIYQPKIADLPSPTLSQIAQEPAEDESDLGSTTNNNEEQDDPEPRVVTAILDTTDVPPEQILLKQMLNHPLLDEATKQSLLIIIHEDLIRLSAQGLIDLANIPEPEEIGMDTDELQELEAEDPTVQDTRPQTASALELRPQEQTMRQITALLSPEAKAAMDLLVRHHIRYIFSRTNRPRYSAFLVRRMISQGKRWDLIQAGAEGLRYAIIKFDLSQGYFLLTYASPSIHQAIQRTAIQLAYDVRLPAHRSTELTHLLGIRSGLTKELGREPSPEDLALALLEEQIVSTKGKGETKDDDEHGLTQEQFLAIQDWIDHGQASALPRDLQKIWRAQIRYVLSLLRYAVVADSVSLQHRVGDDEDSEFGDFIPDEETPEPAFLAERRALRIEILRLLRQYRQEKMEKLEDEDKKIRLDRNIGIFIAYFGLEGESKKREALAQIHNLSSERIHSIITKILRYFRDPRHSQYLRDFMLDI